MFDRILEFTPILSKTGIVYKPANKLAQRFCVLNDIDFATREQIKQLEREGYTIKPKLK